MACIMRKNGENYHEFEDVYDITDSEFVPDYINVDGLLSCTIDSLKTKEKTKTYVKIICRLCGAIIRR